MNILCIKCLAQVNCTKMFLFNPHPISIFPKDPIFMPALHTHTLVSFNPGVKAIFPMICTIILSFTVKYNFFLMFLVYWGGHWINQQRFVWSSSLWHWRSHEIRNKFGAQIKQWVIREGKNIQDEKSTVVGWWGGEPKRDRSFYGYMSTPTDLIGCLVVGQNLATGVIALNRWA